MIPITATATIRAPSSSSSWGDSFGAAYQVGCFPQMTRKLVRTASGEDLIAEWTLWIPPQTNGRAGPAGEIPEVPEGSSVGLLGSEGVAVVSRVHHDQNGPSHREVGIR